MLGRFSRLVANFLRTTWWLAIVFAAACGQVLVAAPTSLAPAITLIPSSSTTTPSIAPLPTTATPSPVTSTPPATPSPMPPTPTATSTLVPVVHLMAVGDVMLGRTVADKLRTKGAAIAFSAVEPVLTSADLLVANLECVISPQGEPQPKAYRFRAPPEAVDALAMAGVDVVSIANNHAMDYGYTAMADMIDKLKGRDILTVGAGKNAAAAHAPVIIERKGLRIAFLAYVDVLVEGRTGFDTRTWMAGPRSPGIAWAEPKEMAADIQAAKAQAEVVVVLLHAGLEGRTEILPSQQAEAQAAIDAGAALVLGAHSHVLQNTEKYHGGLIVYSLGNFVFDGFTQPENSTVIFTASLSASGVDEYGWIPVVVEDGLPRMATDQEAAAILSTR
jgi:poly-gamma-glutamate capsule biosynthesis protein CapA/YwtB (metallophosphatase superfamily)